MSTVRITNITPEDRAAIGERARERGLTISAYLLALVHEDLDLAVKRRWFADVAATRGTIGVDAAALIREAREERAAQLDRLSRR